MPRKTVPDEVIRARRAVNVTLAKLSHEHGENRWLAGERAMVQAAYQAFLDSLDDRSLWSRIEASVRAAWLVSAPGGALAAAGEFLQETRALRKQHPSRNAEELVRTFARWLDGTGERTRD